MYIFSKLNNNNTNTTTTTTTNNNNNNCYYYYYHMGPDLPLLLQQPISFKT